MGRRPDEVRSRDDLFDFITDLAEEFEAVSGGWRNRTVPEYLDGPFSTCENVRATSYRHHQRHWRVALRLIP